MMFSENPKIIEVPSIVRLEDIPEPSMCFFCGSTMVKGHVEHWYKANSTIIKNNTSAGYICTNDPESCGLSYVSDQAAIENLRIAITLLSGAEYALIRELIHQQILKLMGKVSSN